MDGQYGDSTRSVKAVGSEAVPGAPVAPPPVPASTYHLSPERRPTRSTATAATHNPTWRQLESALAELEGAAAALTFGSGMAAITSVLRVLAKPGTKLVVPADGYYQVRRYATEYLAPQGITVVEADMRRHVDAAVGRRRGARRNAVQSRPGRRRPAPSGDDVPGPRRDARSSTTPPRHRLGSSRCRWAPTWWWPARPRRCRVTATCSPATSRAATPT